MREKAELSIKDLSNGDKWRGIIGKTRRREGRGRGEMRMEEKRETGGGDWGRQREGEDDKQLTTLLGKLSVKTALEKAL